MNTTAQAIVDYWNNERVIPFKGKLISAEPPKEGEPPTTCMCAQGQVLFKYGGYSEKQLKKTGQYHADREVAKLLGISVAHSVLLRKINDSQDGAPSDVLTNPGKYLGPNHAEVLRFWFFIDTLNKDQWRVVAKRYRALSAEERYAAVVAAIDAGDAANVVVGDNARDAASDAAWFAVDVAAIDAASDAARIAANNATCELIGMQTLKTPPVFLSMFDGFTVTPD